MNHEPIQFLPVNNLGNPARGDSRPAWFLAGVVVGVVGAVLVAWLLIMAHVGLTI